ncbi:heme ABC transporter ATP-binding protein [Kocuria massiliensis]|uniref:heme ABC transporter ATP-binding protein n=1 Tax=Kocuria massiliensis TaxID=1926282 RepID=UPI000A1CB670|nr:heme ABC transporter ATP-binding protein [Kocuria massiliensis]
MELVEIDGVGLTVGGRAILRDVSFEVRSGEVMALIGPNGAGKSTILSVIAGDLRPDSGSVRLEGREVHGGSPRELARRRSVLPQTTYVSFGYRVREVVAMGRTPWKNTTHQGDDDVVIHESLQETETISLADRDITTLSGGETGRAQFARVLAQRTPLVLLDEPTAALDIRHQERTLRTCRKLADAGSGVVAVVHDLDLAAAYADRVVLFSQGRLVASGSPAEVMTSERLSRVYGWPIDVMHHPVSGRLMVLPVRESGDDLRE